MKVRLVAFDYYSCAPTAGLDPLVSPLDNSRVERVPVLRLFGPTPDGQSVCLHLHQVFPYFFVRSPGDQAEQHDSSDFAMLLKGALCRAMDVSLKRSSNEPGQYVHDIVAVRGKPFYGFHKEEELLWKGTSSCFSEGGFLNVVSFFASFYLSAALGWENGGRVAVRSAAGSPFRGP
jgi:DNA polymerase zeta